MQKAVKLKAIFDTNLLLSVIIVPGSIPDKFIDDWKRNFFILLISPQLIAEFEDVISREKFLKNYANFKENSTELLTYLKAAAELVEPLSENDLPLHSRDPKDDFVLAAALGGNADYLVSGDEDLLTLRKHRFLDKLKIITPREFLELLKE